MEKSKLEEKLKMETAEIEIDLILKNNSNNMPKLFEKIKEIEKIKGNNTSIKMTIIIEDNNKYYRSILKNTDVKIFDEVQEVGKNTIV